MEICMNNPEISVIVVTYNRANLLRRAIESILKQSFQNFEIIIIDNASKDDTISTLNELRQIDDRIKFFRMCQNVGPGAARNFGVQKAKGKYIAILDDDDIAVPERLYLQWRLLNNCPDIGLTFSPVVWIDDEFKEVGRFPGIVLRGEFPTDPNKVFELLYLESNKIPNTTIMVRREVIAHIGYPSYPWVGEDWFWCMQLSALGIKMRPINEPLVYMLRSFNRTGLTVDKRKAFKDQRLVLFMIKKWLRERGINNYEHLHHKAFANQLVREARFWGGFKGLILCQKALIIDPSNTYAKRTLFELIAKGCKRLGRYLKYLKVNK